MIWWNRSFLCFCFFLVLLLICDYLLFSRNLLVRVKNVDVLLSDKIACFATCALNIVTCLKISWQKPRGRSCRFNYLLLQMKIMMGRLMVILVPSKDPLKMFWKMQHWLNRYVICHPCPMSTLYLDVILICQYLMCFLGSRASYFAGWWNHTSKLWLARCTNWWVVGCSN